MSKNTIIWLVVAGSLVLIGCVLFVGAMTMIDWNFKGLSTDRYETEIHEISEEFSNISINTDTAKIIFVLSDDEKCKVECYEQKNAKHSVVVQDDTLSINVVNEIKWYEYIGLNFNSPKITIYLPQAEYASLFIKESTGDIKIPKDFIFEDVDILLSTGDVDFCASASQMLKISTTTGDISVEDIYAGSVELSVTTGRVTADGVNCDTDVAVSVSTGDAKLSDIVCKSVISRGNTGDISLNNVIASEKFSINRSTGDISFDSSDAAEIFVITDTGGVTGSLLTDKVFAVQTDTGKINVPKTTSGGMCEITTDTGDINITVN